MNGYHFKKTTKPDVVLIHDGESVTYLKSKQDLENDLAHLKANEKAYTDHAYFQRSVKMLEDALRFLQEEA